MQRAGMCGVNTSAQGLVFYPVCSKIRIAYIQHVCNFALTVHWLYARMRSNNKT